MITLLENALHQVTVLGTSLLAESATASVDVTGWRLLDAPEVTTHDDGSITLRFAVPDEPKARMDSRAAFKRQKEAKTSDPILDGGQWPTLDDGKPIEESDDEC